MLNLTPRVLSSIMSSFVVTPESLSFLMTRTGIGFSCYYRKGLKDSATVFTHSAAWQITKLHTLPAKARYAAGTPFTQPW